MTIEGGADLTVEESAEPNFNRVEGQPDMGGEARPERSSGGRPDRPRFGGGGGGGRGRGHNGRGGRGGGGGGRGGSGGGRGADRKLPKRFRNCKMKAALTARLLSCK